MPIPFSCPYCGLETLVDDEHAGQSGACASCGKSITVPYLPAGQPLGSDEVVVGIPVRRRRSVMVIVAVVVAAAVTGAAVLGMLVALLLPAVGTVRSVADRRSCDMNLQRIGLALQAYEAEHGTLPPAFIPDESGKPMHSWRVLLLPYLDERGLYSQYDFNQRWDSPQNQLLARKIPDVYTCPADPDAKPMGETNYMVLTGYGTLFPGAESTSTVQISDAPASTIAVVEAPVSGVTWLEPKDLPVAAMQFSINGGFGKEIASYHAGGANVLMADGTVRFLRETTPSDFVRGMASTDGGEPIPSDVLQDPMGGF